MSAAPSHLDIKPFPVHHLHQDANAPQQTISRTPPLGSEQEHTLLLHHHSSSDFGASTTSSATLHQTGLLDPLDFAADIPSLPYQQHLAGEEEPPLIRSLQQDYGPVLDNSSQQQQQQQQQQPVSSSLPGRDIPAPSLTASLPGYRGRTSSPRGRSSMCGSDQESPSGRPHRDHLDDNRADEFGLTSDGPRDGTDLGSKRKADKTGQEPAWIELKTKAGKERKRLPLACIACRRKKIRCSGEKPACSHCVRSKIPCVYKVTARKAAPRTDYMTMLDKRLKRMEDRIIRIVPKNEQASGPPSVPRANVKPAIPGTLGSGKGPKKRGAEEAFGNGPDLDSWAKGPSTTKLESPTQITLFNESEERQLLQEGMEALPPKEIQEHLAGIFFENVYGQAYHILHQPSYMRKLSAGTLPPVLILSVCAVSARFSKHPKVSTEPAYWRGDEWAEVARDIVTKRYEWPNMTILTCLLLLGLHEFGTCHGGRSWALGGQAIRMAFALQLHKDLDHDPQKPPGTPLTFVDREVRRRTMWACFLMDRFNSSGSNRPTFIKDEVLRIPLPVKEKNFQFGMPAPTENLQGDIPDGAQVEEGDQMDSNANMGVAAYMIKTISIWGRAVMHLKQGGRDMDARLLWEEDSVYLKLVKEAEDMLTLLPDSLQYNPDNLRLHETDGTVNQFVFLHVAIQQNILFLSRLVVTPDLKSSQDVPTSFVTKAGSRAFAAANRISELLKESEAYPTINAPFLGYCAFLSSTVHIFGNFSGNKTMETTSRHHLTTNIRFLHRLKRTWGLFNYMSELLRLHYRACSDNHLNGGLSDFSSAEIFQYGDWFDKYPNGLSDSDCTDPAIKKKKERGEDAVLEQKPELLTVEEFFISLSPKASQIAQNRDAFDRSNSMSTKRNATPLAKRKASMTALDHQSQQLQPLMTDLIPEQLAHLQPQQQQGTHYPNATLGGQTSGAGAFNSLSAAQHPNNYGSNISPISPVTVSHGQFGGHQHGMYNDMLRLQIAQQQQQQQQSMMQSHAMFGNPQGIDSTAVAAALMDVLPGWANSDGSGPQDDARGGSNGEPPPHSSGGPDASHGNPHHTVYGHGHDPSWFHMAAYGLDTTEEGVLGGMGQLEFSTMFGSANTGRAPGTQ